MPKIRDTIIIAIITVIGSIFVALIYNHSTKEKPEKGPTFVPKKDTVAVGDKSDTVAGGDKSDTDKGYQEVPSVSNYITQGDSDVAI